MIRRIPVLALLLPASSFAQVVGETCAKGDQPDLDGLLCLPSYDDELLEIDFRGSAILNGLHGDLLLSPGCGQIGTLLRQVDPPQHYAHEGILTDHGTMVAEVTAATDRYAVGADGDGVQFDGLKFGWPGALNRPIYAAYEGSLVVDPEGVARNLDTFRDTPEKCAGDTVFTPPLVVTFDPALADDTDLDPFRQDLIAAADGAVDLVGNVHYRLGHYSDASVPAPAGIDETWHSGTVPFVSSTYIWGVLKGAGITLEGNTLEDEGHDVVGMAELDALITGDPARDGQYLYTEAERAVAGQWLYNSVYIDTLIAAAEKYGDPFLADDLTDVLDDNSNKIVNCFAFDWCGEEGAPPQCDTTDPDAKDSDCWTSPGTGHTASPEDFLSWDGPADGGRLGYAEELLYAGGLYQRVYRWVPAGKSGTLDGIVRHLGTPVAGAVVELEATTTRSVLTDADGRFSFSGVPVGASLELRACALDILDSTTDVGGGDIVTIAAGVTTSTSLDLSGPCETLVSPTELDRQIVVSGSLTASDHEPVASDVTASFPLSAISVNNEPLDVILSPLAGGQRSHVFTFETCVPDGDDTEVRVVASVTVSLAPDAGGERVGPGITSQVDVDLYEGFGESGCVVPDDEHDLHWHSPLTPIAADTSVQLVSGRQISDEALSMDWFEIDVTVADLLAP